MGEITELLEQLRSGDERAQGQLFTIVYAELQRIARQRLQRNDLHTQLDAPSLVHEAYLRLSRGSAMPAQNRGEFFAYASTVMRNVIIDYLRSRNAQKRGNGIAPLTLTSGRERDLTLTGPELDSLGAALEALERIDQRAHRVVEMRYFGGMTVEEVSATLNLSTATVKRDWLKARGFLLRAIQHAGDTDAQA